MTPRPRAAATPPTARPVHDRRLVDAVVRSLTPVAPDLRVGAMFGSPAAYLGKRMVFCVFGDALGVKVPAVHAEHLVRDGVAAAFRPHGRPPMKEWVALRARADDPGSWPSVLEAAIFHARVIDAPG